MSKALFIILLIVGSYYIAIKLFTKQDLEIEENIIITQSQSYDSNTFYVSPVSIYAYIEGTAKNISDKALKNLPIIYMISQDSAVAEILNLYPGQSQKFRTNNCKIKSTSPGYKLLNKIYENEWNKFKLLKI